jgi:hypothetical protein
VEEDEIVRTCLAHVAAKKPGLSDSAVQRRQKLLGVGGITCRSVGQNETSRQLSPAFTTGLALKINWLDPVPWLVRMAIERRRSRT